MEMIKYFHKKNNKIAKRYILLKFLNNKIIF